MCAVMLDGRDECVYGRSKDHLGLYKSSKAVCEPPCPTIWKCNERLWDGYLELHGLSIHPRFLDRSTGIFY